MILNLKVAGIQCNGCQNVLIKDCTIGPTSRAVPVLATFASARFLLRYTKDIIQYGFNQESLIGLLDTTTVSIASKGTRTVKQIFDELDEVLNSFRDFYTTK